MSDFALDAIGSALDALAVRQRVLADNIANVETPGYKARRVDFESDLANAVRAGDLNQFSINETESFAPARLNGNNVNIDDEVVEATKTSLTYQTMVEALNTRFRILQTAYSPAP